MRFKEITPTKEDYLRALYLMGRSRQRVGVAELARYLHLAKSTVSERIQALARQKLLAYERYSACTFTRRGRAIAQRLTHRHRVIEVFLHDVLHMPKNRIHAEAHRLEHAFSDEVIARLKKFLGNPQQDPHGKPIEK